MYYFPIPRNLRKDSKILSYASGKISQNMNRSSQYLALDITEECARVHFVGLIYACQKLTEDTSLIFLSKCGVNVEVESSEGFHDVVHHIIVLAFERDYMRELIAVIRLYR